MVVVSYVDDNGRRNMGFIIDPSIITVFCGPRNISEHLHGVRDIACGKELLPVNGIPCALTILSNSIHLQK